MSEFNPGKLLDWNFETIEHSYTARDTILYALGIGLGRDPSDPAQLRYVFEEDAHFTTLPTMCTTLATPGFWLRDPELGIAWQKVLHGEQGVIWHTPLPVAGKVSSTLKIEAVEDKGHDKGAMIYTTRELVDTSTNTQIATISSTILARGNGGFGGTATPKRPCTTIPQRPPEIVSDTPTLAQSALIYRLSGDLNPLHASPEIARAAGFDRPILHGLCTFGFVGHAIVKTCCGDDPTWLRSMNLRFSAPVYPGETIRTEIWRDGNTLAFRARAVERNRIILDKGRATLAT